MDTPPPATATAEERAATPRDLTTGLRLLLLLDVAVRLFIWSTALGLTLWIMSHISPPPPLTASMSFENSIRWGGTAVRFALLYNGVYLVLLLLLRLITPTPREGRYPVGGSRLDRQLVYASVLSCLTKARMQAPFPAFLVFQLSNLPPLRWVFGPIFGPRSRSCFVLDPNILDPHLVTLGRNVTIGFGTTIAGHYQERNAVVFARTTIEDDVLIGAHCAIPGGVRIGRGAILAPGSLVVPGTVIGAGEFWYGYPARRRRADAGEGAPS